MTIRKLLQLPFFSLDTRGTEKKIHRTYQDEPPG